MARCSWADKENVMRRWVFVLFLVSLAVGLSPGNAVASDVGCGDTITRDTKLKSDLVDCPGDGIVIGADDITLDLNGHTIEGDGVLSCTEFYACDFGVNNTAGHHGVTIEDGSIRDFATAIFVLGGNHNRLRRLSASHSILGGMLLIASPGTRIAHNSISANGLTTDQAGLIVFDSSETRIERNSVTDNGDIGMFLIGVGDSRVERNSVSGNPEAGMIVDGNRNEVSRNRVFENGDNMVLAGNGNSVTRNHVADALGFPDDPVGGFGIVLDGGDSNLLRGNVVISAASNGIRVTAFDPDLTGAAEDNIILANRVKHARLDGILIDETATDSLVKGNRVMGAGDDGIDVESSATTLTRNTANNNRDLGIEAVLGVTDGGGNKASGNGNPAQCLNVACK
jgi:parallel beta-helix repeat protein